MKNYIFDLYGTLVDIHTNEEKTSLWKSMAMILTLMGAEYTAKELKRQYKELTIKESEKQFLYIKEKYHNEKIREEETEIQLEKVFSKILSDKGVEADQKQVEQLGITFRCLSMEYIRLFDGVNELLKRLKENEKNIYLLSNAQRIFTEPEMRMLGIYDSFDGILYSSDAGVKKPSFYFYNALFQKYGLEREDSVMIGNEYQADILGAEEYGLKSMFIFSAQSGERPLSLPKGCKEIEKIEDVFINEQE